MEDSMTITQVKPGAILIGRCVTSIEDMRNSEVCVWFEDGFMVMPASTVVDAGDDLTFTPA